MNISLPPLRSRIFRGYITIIAVYGGVGFLGLLWILILATNLTPKLIHRNYDSIDSAMEMRKAWHLLWPRNGKVGVEKEQLQTQFLKSLTFEKNNITEEGEGELARAIDSLWNETHRQSEIDDARFYRMDRYFEDLVRINRTAMFRAAEKAESLKTNTIRITIVLSVLGLAISFVLADSFSASVAEPLKQIAESLRGKRKPGEKLKLPPPNSLELRILTQEIRALWDRITEVDKLNVTHIVQQSRELQAVLAAVEDAVLVVDPNQVVKHCNDKMASLLGIGREDILDHGWRDLPTGGENYLKLREILTPQLSDEKVFELESDRGTESYAGRVRSVTGDLGQEVDKVYLLHNVTEKRQRERLKSEFIGVLSHELKTPLQSLGTASELLSGKSSRYDENTQLLIDTIAEDVSRMRGVIHDFVQVSQLSNQSLRLLPETTDLGQVLPTWLKPFRVLAQEKDVSIDYYPAPEPTIVEIDRVKFPWVLTNLMSNAIRVSSIGGRISVRLDRDAGEVRVSVEDEGPGIAPEVRNRIFEPYFKAEPTASEKSAGFLGIGLTIAREVVEAHAGKIEYRPNRPQGAVFKIVLPRKIETPI